MTSQLKKLGIKIGHYTNIEALTGATVIIPDYGANIGFDIRGSDTGTINTPAFEAKSVNTFVNAIVLTGGSTPGLECSIGVMDYLGSTRVTGAVIYDRQVGKNERPHVSDGYEMAKSASYDNLVQGNVGVGTGATVGKWNYENRMKGGFGFSIREIYDNIFVGAFVVTNAMGDIVNPITKEFYSNSGKYNFNNYYSKDIVDGFHFNKIKRGTNTTLAVIVTNVELKRSELMKVSELAHDGMARAIYPVHTNWDGDVIFSISPFFENRIKPKIDSFHITNYVGLAASDVLVEAINNSVEYAESIKNFRSLKDCREVK